MQKIALFTLCVTLAGCTTLQTINKPSETIPNPKCENIPALEVFQVLDKFVLADACEEEFGDICFKHTHVVYVEKEKDKIYYDDQKIIPSSGQCFEYVGTYKYTTRTEANKVVPKAKLVSATVPSPEYENWKKEQENKSVK